MHRKGANAVHSGRERFLVLRFGWASNAPLDSAVPPHQSTRNSPSVANQRVVDIAREAGASSASQSATSWLSSASSLGAARRLLSSKCLASLRCARDSVQHPFAVLVCLDRLPREGQMRIAFDDSGPLRYDGEARKGRESYAA